MAVRKLSYSTLFLVLGSLGCFCVGLLIGRSSLKDVSSVNSVSVAKSVVSELPFPFEQLRRRPVGVKTVIISTAVGYSEQEWLRFVVTLRRVRFAWLLSLCLFSLTQQGVRRRCSCGC
jgi:hypothetical protein